MRPFALREGKFMKKRCIFSALICAGLVLTGCSSAASIGDEDSMKMGDYSVIEIEQSAMDAIDDDFVQEYIDAMLEEYAETYITADGTVEDGDDVYVSFSGTVNGETIEGSTTDGTTISVGSGEYIEGFEEGLIGVEIGDTVELEIEYPEDYDDETLAGQTAIFTITVQYITETIAPDLDDDFVQENSLEYLGVQLSTTDELYEYVYDYFYTYFLHSAMLDQLKQLQTVVTYGQENYDLLYEYAAEELAYYASYYDTDEDSLAVEYGYEDAEEYITEEVEYYDDLIILFDFLWEDIGLGEYTQEDVDAELEVYLEENGYSDTYTLDEFKESCSEAWLVIFEGINFKYDTIMEALEDRVVFVESEE